MNSLKLQEAEVRDALPRLSSGLENGFLNLKNGLFVYHEGRCFRLTFEYCTNRDLKRKAERIAIMGLIDSDYPIIMCSLKMEKENEQQ